MTQGTQQATAQSVGTSLPQVNYSSETERMIVESVQSSLLEKEKEFSGGVTIKTIIQEAQESSRTQASGGASYDLSKQAQHVFVNTMLFCISLFAISFFVAVLYILFAKVVSGPLQVVLTMFEDTRETISASYGHNVLITLDVLTGGIITFIGLFLLRVTVFRKPTI